MIVRLTPTQWNLVAGFLGNVLQVLLAVGFLPLFLRLLGIEGYGLFGIFLLLQTLLAAVPQGLNSALTLEVARRVGTAGSEGGLWALTRQFERAAWLFGLALMGLIVVASPWVARDWLQTTDLPNGEVTRALRWIGLALALQWPMTVYSSVLTGMQRQGALQCLQVGASLARYPGSVLLLWQSGADIVMFFQYQAAVATAQALVGRVVMSRPLRAAVCTRADWRALWRTALGLSAVIFPAMFFVQLDRLYLSRAVPLESFGHYVLAATAAGALAVLSSPVVQVLYPRFAQLRAQGRPDLAQKLYLQSSQFTATLVAPAAMVLIVFPGPTLFAWTGDTQVTAAAAPILRWLATGWFIHEILSSPKVILMAADSRRHFAGLEAGAVALLVVLLAWLTHWRGTEGAALAWCLVNLAVILPVAWMAERLVGGSVRDWIGKVVLRTAILAALPVLAFSCLDPPAGRWGLALFLGAAYGSSMLLAWIGTPVTREWTLSKLARRR